MKDHLILEAVLFIEDGIIAGFGEMRNTPCPKIVRSWMRRDFM